jgi:hypothetical protein
MRSKENYQREIKALIATAGGFEYLGRFVVDGQGGTANTGFHKSLLF